MTQKEKATELVNRMYLKVGNVYDHELEINSFTEQKLRAKQCALIAVDEIISLIPITCIAEIEQKEMNYWQDVKKEIGLL